MEEFFNVCVDKVIGLITGHFAQIEEEGGQPKVGLYILLRIGTVTN